MLPFSLDTLDLYKQLSSTFTITTIELTQQQPNTCTLHYLSSSFVRLSHSPFLSDLLWVKSLCYQGGTFWVATAHEWLMG